MGEVVYLPVDQELLVLLEHLREDSESVQDVIKRLVEEKLFLRDFDALQAEKMKELWDNEDDEIWNNLA